MSDAIRHEISNVLNIVLGNAELLLAEDLDPDAREMSQEILDASQRLRGLLEKLPRSAASDG